MCMESISNVYGVYLKGNGTWFYLESPGKRFYRKVLLTFEVVVYVVGNNGLQFPWQVHPNRMHVLRC